MVKDLYIPPILMRPCSNRRVDDDLTIRLREIIRVNKFTSDHTSDPEYGKMYANLAMFKVPGDDTNTIRNIRDFFAQTQFADKQTKRFRRGTIPPYLEEYFTLSKHVMGYVDNRFFIKQEYEFGRELRSVRNRFTGSKKAHGRIRQNAMGKRTDYNSRAVSGCDNFQDVDEVGMPITQAMKLVMKIRVARYNIKLLREYVDNGPDRYPGANQVERDGTTYDLAHHSNIDIRLGDIVHRHIVNGDQVILNRQPSLHRYALMSYRVVIHHHHVLKANIAVTTPLGLDFDGDEVNCYVSHDPMAVAELQELMSVRHNMVKDGSMIVKFVQHAVIGAWYMFRNMCIDREDIVAMIMSVRSNTHEFSVLMHAWASNEPVSGKMLLKALFELPEAPSSCTKKTMNAYMFHYWKRNGGTRACDFMSNVIRMLETYLYVHNCSISAHECIVNLSPSTTNVVRRAIEYVDGVNDPGGADVQQEDLILGVLDRARDIASKEVEEKLSKHAGHNGLYDLVTSQAKGSIDNIVQNSALVGQQRNKISRRVPERLPHTISKAHRRGMITNSFMDGLTGTEFFFQLMSARVGLVNTSVTTAETGYIYRKLYKGMEDMMASFDGSVRDKRGQVYEFMYGNDGFDNDCLQLITCTCIQNMSECDWSEHEGLYVTALRDKILARKNMLHDNVNEVPSPTNFDYTIEDPTGEFISSEHMEDMTRVIWDRMCLYQDSTRFQLLFFEQTRVAMMRRRGIYTNNQYVQYMKVVCRDIEKCRVDMNTPVGMISSQSMGEPLTQCNLSQFHSAGYANPLSTGVPRVKELVNMTAMATPSMTIVFKDGHDCHVLGSGLVQKTMTDVVEFWSHVPFSTNNARVNMFRRSFNAERNPKFSLKLHLVDIQPITVVTGMVDCLSRQYPEVGHVVSFSLPTDRPWVMFDVYDGTYLYKAAEKALTSFQFQQPGMVCMAIYEKIVQIMSKVTLKGLSGITDYMTPPEGQCVHNTMQDGIIKRITMPTIVTRGTNLLDILTDPTVDVRHTFSNDIQETYRLFGIDATRNALIHELELVMGQKSPQKRRHVTLIASGMTVSGIPYGFCFSGFNQNHNSPLKVSSFEQVIDGFVKMGIAGHYDSLDGVSEACMVGVPIPIGTALVGIKNTAREPLPHVGNHNDDVISNRANVLGTSHVHTLNKIMSQQPSLDPLILTSEDLLLHGNMEVLMEQSKKRANILRCVQSKKKKHIVRQSRNRGVKPTHILPSESIVSNSVRVSKKRRRDDKVDQRRVGGSCITSDPALAVPDAEDPSSIGAIPSTMFIPSSPVNL
jgi:DNA-directed RNA polymerase beta' subunit